MALLGWSSTGVVRGADPVGRAGSSRRERRRAVRLRPSVVAMTFLLAASAAVPSVAAAPVASAPPEGGGVVPTALSPAVPHPPALAPDAEPATAPDPAPAQRQAPSGTEVVSARTASSQTYAQPDGSFVTELYASPRFYQPAGSSEWQPIELGFTAHSGPGPAAVAEQGPVRTSLGDPRDPAGFMSVAGPEHTVSFHLAAAQLAAAAPSAPALAASGRSADYIGLLPGGIDLRVYPRADGVKSFLVLHSPPAAASFAYQVDAPGLTLRQGEDGSVLLLDARGDAAGRIPRPYMVDSTPNERVGSGMRSSAVALTLSTQGTRPTITLTPDPAFLAHATYPVYVDPSLIEIPTDAGSIEDVFVCEQEPVTQFEGYQDPETGYYELPLGTKPGELYDANRIFIQFPDLASTLGPVDVDAANLELYPYHTYYDAPTTSRAYVSRVTESWYAPYLSWSNQPDTAPLVNTDLTYSAVVEGEWAQFDLTATVQGWLDGSLDNYGVAITEGSHEDDESYWKRFVASEDQGGDGPVLSIAWHTPTATPLAPTDGAWAADRVLSWSFDDNGSWATRTQSDFEVQLSASSSFGTLLPNGDSGEVAGDATSWTIPGNVSFTDGTTYYWRILVRDGVGWSDWASASFRPDAIAPTAIITSPAQDAGISGTVTVHGTASDATSFDHYVLDYGVGTWPQSWTTITTSAAPVTNGTLASWNTAALAGIYTLRLRVYDGARLAEGYSTLLRRVTVGSGARADISTPAPASAVRGSLTIVGTANASSGFTGYTLERGSGCSPVSWTAIGVNPRTTPVTRSTLGSWNTTAVADGLYTIRLITSSSGGSATATACISVDNSAPSAAISDPPAGQPLGGDVTVRGSATDAGGLLDWTLEYGAGATPASWSSLASGSGAISDEALGIWHTGSLAGVYTLRLTVRDQAGNANGVVSHTVYLESGRRGAEPYVTSVPFDLGGGLALGVGVANGELTLDRTAFTIPSYGPPQALTLHYSSAESTHAGRLGYGWISNLTQYLTADGDFLLWHRADGGIEPFGQVGGVWTPGAGHFETLEHDTGAGTYVITAKDQSQLVFADSSPYRLVAVKDRFGHALTLAWSSSSATATDVSSRASAIAINAANDCLTSVTDSAGRAWSFSYDANQQLTGLTDPEDALTTFAYDANHRLNSISRSRSRKVGNPETIVWAITYDPSGRALVVTDPEEALAYREDCFGYGDTVTLAALAQDEDTDAVTTYILDDDGRVTQFVDPEAGIHTRTYDTDGNVLSATEPIDESVSRTISWTYDDHGNPLSETSPIDATSSVTTTWTYNATNDVTLETQAAGTSIEQRTAYTYSGGHLVEQELNPQLADGPDGQVSTTYTYSAHDQLETETDPLGRVTEHLYDSAGNEIALIRNSVTGACTQSDCNVETDNVFDANTVAGLAGLITSQTDPTGATTAATYDALGRVLTLDAPADSGAPATTTTNVWDELGNLLSRTVSYDETDYTTSYAYDLLNHRTQTTDPRGALTVVASDFMGNSTIVTPPVTDATTSEFDGLSQAVTTEPSDSVQIQHQLDAAGHEIETVWATDGASVPDPLVRRTYDLAGRLLSETEDPNGLALTTSYTYDLLGRTLSETGPDGTLTRYAYDRLGRICRELDAASELESFTCASEVSGSPTTNILTSYTYDKVGRTLLSEGPYAAGETPPATLTQYDDLDRPTLTVANYVQGSQDPDANIASATYYDRADRVVATTDALGVVSRSIYNDRGWVVRQIVNCTDSGSTPSPDPANCTGAGTHDAATNVVTDTTYDGTGQVLTTIARDPTNPAHDVVTASAYDESGELIETTVDAGEGTLNITTQYAYDDAGRQIATRDPAGTISRSIYDGQGNLVTSIENCTNSGTTVPTSGWESCAGTGTHDATWNRTTSYVYDDLGQTIWEQAPNGRVTTYAYDNTGQLISQTDNAVVGTPNPDENLVTTYAYDDDGNQVGVRAPTADRETFRVTATVYDDLGRQVEKIENCTDDGTAVPATAVCAGTGTQDAETNVITTWSYDAAGNNVTQTSPDPSDDAEGTASVTTAYAYDRLNRLCRTVENATVDLASLDHPCSDTVQGDASTNVSTRYAYDETGNQTGLIDAAGHSQSFGYDALGRLTSRTDADAATIYWGYDARGNRVDQTNRADTPPYASITWTYDGADRLTGRTADGATVEYGYDELGHLASAESSAGTISATYDRLGRPLEIEGDDEALTSYAYDDADPQRDDPSGEYAFSLDRLGREMSLAVPDPNALLSQPYSLAWRADGAYAGYGDAEGETGGTLDYDPLGRLVASWDYGDSGNETYATYAYTYNRAGLRQSEVSQIEDDPDSGSSTFAYDPLGRLTSYTSSVEGQSQTYTWAQVANRTSVATDGGDPLSSTYDAANRLIDSGYSVDADGRLVARPGQDLVWDDLGRLTEVDDSVTQDPLSLYTYDALDRLRTVERSGQALRFVYVALTSDVAQILDDDTSDVLLNVAHRWSGEAFLDWIVDENETEVVRLYGINGHGDTTWVGDEGGAPTASVHYNPFGVPIAASGSAMPDWGFDGDWTDTASGLVWDGARWYAPDLGLYLSEDVTSGAPTSYASSSNAMRQTVGASFDELYGAAPPTQSGSLDPLASNVHNSRKVPYKGIVRLQTAPTDDPNNPNKKELCTGFLVPNGDTVVTAAHCVYKYGYRLVDWVHVGETLDSTGQPTYIKSCKLKKSGTGPSAGEFVPKDWKTGDPDGMFAHWDFDYAVLRLNCTADWYFGYRTISDRQLNDPNFHPNLVGYQGGSLQMIVWWPNVYTCYSNPNQICMQSPAAWGASGGPIYLKDEWEPFGIFSHFDPWPLTQRYAVRITSSVFYWIQAKSQVTF